MPIRISQSPELMAVILTLKRSDAYVRKEMRAAARTEANALWRPALAQHADHQLQLSVIVKGARVRVGMSSFDLLAATSRRALSGGLIPEKQWQAAEFGLPLRTITYERGGRTITARHGAQFPSKNPKGHVAYAAARDIGPRVVAAWVNGAVRGLVQANRNLETSSGN